MQKRRRIRELQRIPRGTRRFTNRPTLTLVSDRPSRWQAARLRTRDRVESWFTGLSYYVAAACVCLMFALLGFFAVRLSPDDMLLWTGTKVVGYEQGGIVFYHWHDRQYTLDVPGYASHPSVTVYLNPADPPDAVTDSLGNRVLDGMYTVVPAALGIMIVAIGVWRRRMAGRQSIAYVGGYGRGLDPAVVDRLLAECRTQKPSSSAR
jgi:hypothetical protein